MKILMKKEVYGSRKQCMGSIRSVLALLKRASQKKKTQMQERTLN